MTRILFTLLTAPALIFALAISFPVGATIHRSAKATADFKRANRCPASGRCVGNERPHHAHFAAALAAVATVDSGKQLMLGVESERNSQIRFRFWIFADPLMDQIRHRMTKDEPGYHLVPLPIGASYDARLYLITTNRRLQRKSVAS